MILYMSEIRRSKLEAKLRHLLLLTLLSSNNPISLSSTFWKFLRVTIFLLWVAAIFCLEESISGLSLSFLVSWRLRWRDLYPFQGNRFIFLLFRKSLNWKKTNPFCGNFATARLLAYHTLWVWSSPGFKNKHIFVLWHKLSNWVADFWIHKRFRFHIFQILEQQYHPELNVHFST